MLLDEISDDLLINLYREGSQIAIDLLYERYNVFLYGFIHRMLRVETLYYDYTELYQELIMVFINCLQRYDEENGCFYFFVKKAVERKLIELINKIKKNKNLISLDDFMYQDGDESCLDYISEDGTVEYYETNLYKFIIERLDVLQTKIMNMKIEGYTYEEIASILGLSKQSVYRKINIIKNIIKDVIEKID